MTALPNMCVRGCCTSFLEKYSCPQKNNVLLNLIEKCCPFGIDEWNFQMCIAIQAECVPSVFGNTIRSNTSPPAGIRPGAHHTDWLKISSFPSNTVCEEWVSSKVLWCYNIPSCSWALLPTIAKTKTSCVSEEEMWPFSWKWMNTFAY
jgi:hypothetical protein